MIVLLVPCFGARAAATSVELAVTGTPILHPETFSAGTYANGICVELAFPNGISAATTKHFRSEFFLSRNDSFGDGDDVKIGEFVHTLTSNNSPPGGSVTSYGFKMESPSYLTNLFIPSNLSGDYYFFHRVSFVPGDYEDIDSGNNVARGARLIHVRPPPGLADTYAPATIDNQRIMLVNTASARGTDGLGNILVSMGAGTFSIPYRSASLPAESGTCNYAVTGGSSAQVTTLTMIGALAGLQRSLTLTFDSTNTGTYVFTATMGGSLVDGGSGFFYEVMPIQCKLNGGDRQSALTWSGGAPPFWVETATNLAGTDVWTNLLDQWVVFLGSWSKLPAPTNGAVFFRVRGQ
jgi:hypothetical protein